MRWCIPLTVTDEQNPRFRKALHASPMVVTVHIERKLLVDIRYVMSMVEYPLNFVWPTCV